MKVYVIIMYRWGDENSHSYLYGVELDKETALKEAKEAEEYRGRKYEAEVVEIETGKSNTRKYIKNIFSRQSAKNNIESYENPEKAYKNDK